MHNQNYRNPAEFTVVLTGEQESAASCPSFLFLAPSSLLFFLHSHSGVWHSVLLCTLCIWSWNLCTTCSDKCWPLGFHAQVKCIDGRLLLSYVGILKYAQTTPDMSESWNTHLIVLGSWNMHRQHAASGDGAVGDEVLGDHSDGIWTKSETHFRADSPALVISQRECGGGFQGEPTSHSAPHTDRALGEKTKNGSLLNWDQSICPPHRHSAGEWDATEVKGKKRKGDASQRWPRMKRLADVAERLRFSQGARWHLLLHSFVYSI